MVPWKGIDDLCHRKKLDLSVTALSTSKGTNLLTRANSSHLWISQNLARTLPKTNPPLPAPIVRTRVEIDLVSVLQKRTRHFTASAISGLELQRSLTVQGRLEQTAVPVRFGSSKRACREKVAGPKRAAVGGVMCDHLRE